MRRCRILRRRVAGACLRGAAQELSFRWLERRELLRWHNSVLQAEPHNEEQACHEWPLHMRWLAKHQRRGHMQHPWRRKGKRMLVGETVRTQAQNSIHTPSPHCVHASRPIRRIPEVSLNAQTSLASQFLRLRTDSVRILSTTLGFRHSTRQCTDTLLGLCTATPAMPYNKCLTWQTSQSSRPFK